MGKEKAPEEHTTVPQMHLFSSAAEKRPGPMTSAASPSQLLHIEDLTAGKFIACSVCTVDSTPCIVDVMQCKEFLLLYAGTG
jgi:hypothetical protein